MRMKKNKMKKTFFRSLIFVMGLILMLGSFGTTTQAAVTTTNNKHFMVYYRAWRDKTMQGVNTSLPDQNWITMSDIPYGIDIVNVFSYVPKGQEAQAQPFYDALKTKYAPELHARGARLVRGIDYGELLKISYAGEFPTDEEFDNYAKEMIAKYVDAIGIDGLDIDMETKPTADQIKISDGVIKALSKYLGPKSGTNRPLLYDTNASNLAPFENVSDAFDFLAYQQYGSDDKRTEKAVNDYSGVLAANKFVPGLTFPEEQDPVNRWYDATEPYLNSNFYKVANYANQNNLGGMFIYALDRDGRTYDAADWSHIKPSNLLWTKTAIMQSGGETLANAKEYADHFWNRVKYTADTKDNLTANIMNAKTIYDVNKVILGKDYGQGISSTYDPILEKGLLSINVSDLTAQLNDADKYIEHSKDYDSTKIAELKAIRDEVAKNFAGKTYTQEQIDSWTAKLTAANNGLLGYSETKVKGILDTKSENDLSKSYVELYDINGKTVSNRGLQPKTAWVFDRKLTNNKNGKVYYRVATNEYVSEKDVNVRKGDSVGNLDNIEKVSGVVSIDKSQSSYSLYKQDGSLIGNRGLAGGTDWVVSAKASNANGNLFYKVATNEWLMSGNGVSFN